MRIIFFGSKDNCDPAKIGGSESIVRRLAMGLSSKSHSVAVIMYGANEKKSINNFLGYDLRLKYCCSFSDSLRELTDTGCDLVIETYIHKSYYPQYLAFKRRNCKSIRFSIIFMTAAHNSLKRWFRSKLRTMFCSTVFGVSSKLVNELQRDGVSAIWLPPPVPDQYFCSPENNGKTKTVISYLGRITPDKGLSVLVSILSSLPRSEQITARVRGYYIPGNLNEVRLHKSLQNLSILEYFAEPYNLCDYNPHKEQAIIEYLSDTDILVLPYKSLRGTVNLPLLVVEGLATGCAVISQNFEDMARIGEFPKKNG